MKILCANRAAAVGLLHEQDRKALERIYTREYAGGIDAGLTPAAAETRANQQLDLAMQHIRAQLRRVALLQRQAIDRFKEAAAQFRNRKGEPDIGEFAMQYMNELHSRSGALLRMDLAELGSLIHNFRRDWFHGLRNNRLRMDLVVEELFGNNTGDSEAATFADAWRSLIRKKVEQLNGAGSDIPFREDWNMPQTHDAMKVDHVKVEEWKNFILPLLDQDRMLNPETRRTFTASELDEFLNAAYENITYHGRGKAPEEGGFGTATWRRHADARHFVFKDAPSWRAYSDRFGQSVNPFEVMMTYLRSVNHQLAAMHLLGPNPESTVHYIAGSNGDAGGLIDYHAREAANGRPALFPEHNDSPLLGGDLTNPHLVAKFKGTTDRKQYAANKAVAVQQEWRYISGAMRRPLSHDAAYFEANVSNLLYAKLLPFTTFLTGSDLMNQALTRWFTGVSNAGSFRDFLQAAWLTPDRNALSQLGIETDVGLSALWAEARDLSAIQGHPFTRWIADRATQFTFLKPITLGMRAMWTLGVLHEVTNNLHLPFARIPTRFRDTLAKYNIGDPEWRLMQATPLTSTRGVNVIKPGDIARTPTLQPITPRPGLTAGEEVAARLMTLILNEGESAVISGTPRSARVIPYRPGTFAGSAAFSISRLKTYSISHFQVHGFRAAEIFHRNGGGVKGTAAGVGYYIAGLLIPSMFLVGVGTVAQDVLSGRNPPDVTDLPNFWQRVFWRTVSMGFLNDWFQNIFHDDVGTGPVTATMHSAGQLAGTQWGAYTDAATMLNDAYRYAHGSAVGEDTSRIHIGRQAIRTGHDFVPRTWETDLAMERLVWDNVQRAVDPEAEQDMARRSARVPQGWWWGPGDAGPHAIDWSTLDLTDQNSNLGGTPR